MDDFGQLVLAISAVARSGAAQTSRGPALGADWTILGILSR